MYLPLEQIKLDADACKDKGKDGKIKIQRVPVLYRQMLMFSPSNLHHHNHPTHTINQLVGRHHIYYTVSASSFVDDPCINE